MPVEIGEELTSRCSTAPILAREGILARVAKGRVVNVVECLSWRLWQPGPDIPSRARMARCCICLSILRPISTGNQITGMRMLHHDITGRVIAEQKLRESEKRFKGIVSWSPIGIAVCDASGSLTEMKQGFLRHVRHPRSCAAVRCFI